MNGGSLFKRSISSSWFLAGIPAILMLFFLPRHDLRYRVLIEPQGSSAGQSAHTDLNSDSVTEYVRAGGGIPYYYIIVFDFDRKVRDQWNLPDDIDNTLSGFFFGNFDHDKFKEIYIFTHKGDSLFLNINEFLEHSGTKMEHVFITKIGFIKGEVTSTVWPAGFYDADNEGRDQLYFCIKTGFGLEPRKVYSYDIVRHKLKESQFTGVMYQDPIMTDADADGEPEIFGLMSATGNYKTKTPYSDWSAWLMVLNYKLDFKFPPVEFRGFPGYLDVKAFSGDSVKGYILSHRAYGYDSTFAPSQLALYSTEGRLLRSRNYSDLGINKPPYMFVVRRTSSDRIFVLDNKIFEFNENLDIVKTSEISIRSPYSAFRTDMNSDGNEEFLLYSSEEEKLVVFNSDFQLIAEEKFKPKGIIWEFSGYVSREKESKLFMYTAGYEYFLSLIKNKYYYVNYLAIPGTYLVFLILIIAAKKINSYQVIQKENLKNKLIMLQLNGIKSQLDPHFTFSTLNSIASLIYHEDRQAAYDYMTKFTILLREMLSDADKIYRTLDNEIKFVKTYLDLEMMRLGGSFTYDIKIGEGVTQSELVPKLVLQTFAENSVKHGIFPYSVGGTLRISIVREKNHLKITIEDNGIGRKIAAGKSNSTGMGLKLTGEFYDILNQINKKPIRHQITDLFKASGDPAGTRVEVWIPVPE